MFRHALHHHDIRQRRDDPGTGPAAFRSHQQAFARVFIDQVEQPYTAAIMCPCAHEVVAPYMVRMHGPEPHTRAVVEPQSSTWLLLLRNLQPLATPDTLHAILAHPPSGTLEKRRDPAIPVTAVLAGKLDDRLRECIFVFTPYRAIALRAARLVAEAIGLSVPVPGIIDVSQSIIEGNPQLYIDHGPKSRQRCSSGLQFGSQFAGSMVSRRVDEYLSEEQLLSARNLEQFAGILAFDKWTGNSDARQVVYRRGAAERGHSALFIDQGACFNMGEWNFRDAPLKGVFAQNGAYSTVTGWNSFEPWLSRIEQFNPQSLWEIADAVPPEWYEGNVSALDALVDKLISRRWRVRELVDQFRQSSRAPFPNWKNMPSAIARPRHSV